MGETLCRGNSLFFHCALTRYECKTRVKLLIFPITSDCSHPCLRPYMHARVGKAPISRYLSALFRRVRAFVYGELLLCTSCVCAAFVCVCEVIVCAQLRDVNQGKTKSQIAHEDKKTILC